ncbi:hypothetical protein AEM42_13995 [Betaproteobacteria bacterium UKL13-2]|nr:hypothetical protein AEM42_13995 [Betaproteobacteria bacterium UKL13-2]
MSLVSACASQCTRRRNNIRFVPSYGSVQGADDTLNKLAGNAFDTSSLLIALYRAANIPARYAYGTVELSSKLGSDTI